jgi:hypothetical protein
MITTMFGFLAASARTASLGKATAAVSIIERFHSLTPPNAVN